MMSLVFLLILLTIPRFESYQSFSISSSIFQRLQAGGSGAHPAQSFPRKSNSNSSKPQSSSAVNEVRLNKCLSSLSRRAADDAIAQGRVTVNNIKASPGMKVRFGDVIRLDSQVHNWEERIRNTHFLPSESFDEQKFVYLKYWKPIGVTCTNDLSDRDNIIQFGKFSLYPQRLFTVGRLDKDSSGLILLTSDGRVNNALLNSKMIKEKVNKALLILSSTL